MKNYSNYDPRKVVITVDKNVTLARIFDDNNEVVSKGVVKCSPEDTFDFELGSKLALTRALEAMKSKQEWVVVNRKPCDGDYVRIVDPCFTFNEKGDILRVTRADDWRVFIKASDHPRYESNVSVSSHGKDFQWCYLFGYVEVVEPANPEPPKNSDINWVVVKRRAEAGDFIRLKCDSFSFNKVGDILRVAKSYDGGTVVKVRAEDHPRNEWACLRYGGKYLWNYLNFEFEVVDPLPKKPEFRKITRLPKSGDYMRVLASLYSFDTPDRYLKIDHVCIRDGRVSCVNVHSDDHPGALAQNKRCGVGWNYTPGFLGDEVEFYEKV